MTRRAGDGKTATLARSHLHQCGVCETAWRRVLNTRCAKEPKWRCVEVCATCRREGRRRIDPSTPTEP